MFNIYLYIYEILKYDVIYDKYFFLWFLIINSKKHIKL